MMGNFDPRTPIVRWTPLRKFELVEAIKYGRITEDEAVRIHSLSQEELGLWREALNEAAPSKLRVTKLDRSTKQHAE